MSKTRDGRGNGGVGFGGGCWLYYWASEMITGRHWKGGAEKLTQLVHTRPRNLDPLLVPSVSTVGS